MQSKYVRGFVPMQMMDTVVAAPTPQQAPLPTFQPVPAQQSPAPAQSVRAAIAARLGEEFTNAVYGEVHGIARHEAIQVCKSMLGNHKPPQEKMTTRLLWAGGTVVGTILVLEGGKWVWRQVAGTPTGKK